MTIYIRNMLNQRLLISNFRAKNIIERGTLFLNPDSELVPSGGLDLVLNRNIIIHVIINQIFVFDQTFPPLFFAVLTLLSFIKNHIVQLFCRLFQETGQFGDAAVEIREKPVLGVFLVLHDALEELVDH